MKPSINVARRPGSKKIARESEDDCMDDDSPLMEDYSVSEEEPCSPISIPSQSALIGSSSPNPLNQMVLDSPLVASNLISLVSVLNGGKALCISSVCVEPESSFGEKLLVNVDGPQGNCVNVDCSKAPSVNPEKHVDIVENGSLVGYPSILGTPPGFATITTVNSLFHDSITPPPLLLLVVYSYPCTKLLPLFNLRLKNQKRVGSKENHSSSAGTSVQGANGRFSQNQAFHHKPKDGGNKAPPKGNGMDNDDSLRDWSSPGLVELGASCQPKANFAVYDINPVDLIGKNKFDVLNAVDESFSILCDQSGHVFPVDSPASPKIIQSRDVSIPPPTASLSPLSQSSCLKSKMDFSVLDHFEMDEPSCTQELELISSNPPSVSI
ncbi:hypothetical protein L1887_07015 [Cichorium endivia]|nr:hypothetical protein L1887_07015 [Cichorium endivia]